MAGYDNIKKYGFDKRTAGERREIAKKAGKASGEARKRKADFRRTLNILLTTEIDSPEWTPFLESLGLDSTLESAMLMTQIKAAMAGNTKAAYFVAQYAGQYAQTELDDEMQRLDIEKKKTNSAPVQEEMDDSIREMEAYFEQQKAGDSGPAVE